MTERSSNYEQIVESADWITAKLGGLQPEFALILGSGLGDLADQLSHSVVLPYADIPHFPQTTVEGHAGRLVAGMLENRPVIAMQGRFHYYEGYSLKQVVFPVYVFRRLGVQTLVVTNAAGALNRSYKPGDLMLIADHINMTGDNPLIGPNDSRLGPRFPDMSEAYCGKHRELVRRLAESIAVPSGGQLTVQEGVYCGISGPSYMTPSELNMLAKLGGDAVGMSTVPEVIAARHCGLRVLGISCITDMAIGDELEPLTHEQVIAAAEQAKPNFMALVKAFIREAEHDR